MVLVDSSVYIHLLRSGLDPAAELVARFDRLSVATCDVVRCEVLRGIIPKGRRDKFAAFFDLLVHVPMDWVAWKQTEELAWHLDRAGKAMPLADLIIAVCAYRLDAELLTRDEHFQSVPELRLAEW